MRNRNALVLLITAILLVNCGSDSVTNSGASGRVGQELGECVEYDGFPVVWDRHHSLADERIVFEGHEEDPDWSWPLDESQFLLMSAYWALTPNPMYDFDPSARHCVDPGDRWVALARHPSAEMDGRWAGLPVGDPTQFDPSMWEQVIAHPWRFDRWGPFGAADQQPHYRGVVLFGDQIATTSAACDTRPNVIQIVGDAIAPIEWPVSEQTMVCVPPPGIEPLSPDEPGTPGLPASLPIGGVYSLEGEELVITFRGYEYRYIPISVDEYVTDFDREAFFPISDPLNELKQYKLDTFDELDNPIFVPTQTTLR